MLNQVTLRALSRSNIPSGALFLVVLLTLCAVGPLLGSYYVFLLTEILIWGLFAMSFDILFGYTGLLSFGQSMFFGIGAYGVLLSIVRLDANLIEALAIAVIASLLVALIAGQFALRLKGHHFVIVTVMFSLVVFFLATNARWLTGGDDGISIELPSLQILKVTLTFYEPMTTYYFVLVIVSAAFALCWRLVHSPFGRVLVAIRENEKRARFLGYNVQRFKLASYVISGMIGGLSGGLYTIVLRYASTNFLYWTVSGDAVIWTIFGGKGTLFGPFIGSLLFVVVKDELSSMFAIYPIIVGLILIVFILKAPAGIVGLLGSKSLADRSVQPSGKETSFAKD